MNETNHKSTRLPHSSSVSRSPYVSQESIFSEITLSKSLSGESSPSDSVPLISASPNTTPTTTHRSTFHRFSKWVHNKSSSKSSSKSSNDPSSNLSSNSKLTTCTINKSTHATQEQQYALELEIERKKRELRRLCAKIKAHEAEYEQRLELMRQVGTNMKRAMKKIEGLNQQVLELQQQVEQRSAVSALTMDDGSEENERRVRCVGKKEVEEEKALTVEKAKAVLVENGYVVRGCLLLAVERGKGESR
ncbi:MAG: hypothetical protein Q9186_005674 [Xanthomendoza sp. 1 TL-2023]